MKKTINLNKALLSYLYLLLFFVLGTVYFSSFSDYIFFYQEKSSLFLVSMDFLLEHLDQPGGFLIWLGELQTSLYFYPVLGAIIISLEICGIIYLVQRISGNKGFYLSFVVGAALFYLQANYQYLAFNTLGVLISLLFFLMVLKIKKSYLWVAVFLVPFFYFFLGSFSSLFMTLFCIKLMKKRAWVKMATAMVLWLGFFFIGKEFAFYESTSSLLSYPFEKKDVGSQLEIFILAVGILLILPVIERLPLKHKSFLRIKNVKPGTFIPLVIVGILAILLIKSHDPKDKHYFASEKLFFEGKYHEIIALNKETPSTNSLTAFLNNVALAETGSLSDSFLSFRQMPNGSTLFLEWEIISEVLKRGGHFYYAIGLINEAHRWAYEYMVMEGNSPEVLKMMIKTDLIKGKYKTAEKYISILEKSLFYKNLAKEYRSLLNNSEAIAAHPELGKKQRMEVKNDFFVQTQNPPVNLDYILESDSANLAAIEYKLAWLMLQKDMKGVVDLLPLMERAGYKRIPKNVEEVVVAYKLMRVGKMPELKHLKVQRLTEQQFQQFYRLFQQNQGNKKLAQKALREFSNTYWYYVFFS